MDWFDETGWTGERDDDADRQTASLAAIALTLLLIVVGLYLVHALHGKAVLEDCLMAGRSNCVVFAGR